MAEPGRTVRRPRPCAILIAHNTPWASQAEQIIRSRGYAVAKLEDLHLVDLVVAPGELRVVVFGATLDHPVASQLARLRTRNADLVVISLPEPFDGDQLLRILPPA